MRDPEPAPEPQVEIEAKDWGDELHMVESGNSAAWVKCDKEDTLTIKR